MLANYLDKNLPTTITKAEHWVKAAARLSSEHWCTAPLLTKQTRREQVNLCTSSLPVHLDCSSVPSWNLSRSSLRPSVQKRRHSPRLSFALGNLQTHYTAFRSLSSAPGCYPEGVHPIAVERGHGWNWFKNEFFDLWVAQMPMSTLTSKLLWHDSL